MKTINCSKYKSTMTSILLLIFICIGINNEAKAQIISNEGSILVDKIVSIGKFVYQEEVTENKINDSSIFKYNLNILRKSFNLYLHRVKKVIQDKKVKVTEKITEKKSKKFLK